MPGKNKNGFPNGFGSNNNPEDKLNRDVKNKVKVPAKEKPAQVSPKVEMASNPKYKRKSSSNPIKGNDDSVKIKSNSAQRIENAINAPVKSKSIGKSISGVLSKTSNKTSGSKASQQSFTKSKKNVSNKNLKDNNTKKSSAKETIRKAFDANAVMAERRAKAMANRNPSKNPNNINLRGIVKTNSKKRK